MNVGVAFRSSHPDVMAAISKWRQASKDLWESSHSLAQEVGPDWEPLVLSSFTISMVGLKPKGDDRYLMDVPEGPWRRTNFRDYDCWVPNKRSRAGKELAERLSKLELLNSRPRVPGMPHMWLDTRTNYWFQPSLKIIDDVIWMTWSTDDMYEAIDGDEPEDFFVDSSIWERVKLSEYHSILESEKDNHGGVAV
jgi:hypothetical protein